jgi:hypothetical protein
MRGTLKGKPAKAKDKPRRRPLKVPATSSAVESK